jgi:hypothetical protein
MTAIEVYQDVVSCVGADLSVVAGNAIVAKL